MKPCLCAVVGGLLVALASVLPFAAAIAAKQSPTPRSVTGIVSQVIDGNRLRLSPPDAPTIVVRLQHVEAPELCQAGGEAARQALAEWALNQTGTLQIHGHDREGRTLGTLVVGGLNLNQHLIEEGLAWSSRGRNGRGPLLKQERMAKALARGLHARPGAWLPSEFRRVHGPCPDPVANG